MRGLTPQNLLEVCEWAEHEHPVNKALALLYAACPHTSWEELAALSIGQRDARLLELREKTFGNKLQGFAQCSHCGEHLEFAITTADIRVADTNNGIEPVIHYQGERIRFRLPDSVDLLAINQTDDPIQASIKLVRRCLISVGDDAFNADGNDLPQDMIIAIANHMSLCDPQAEVLLSLRCPACEREFQTLFDIHSFVWAEFVDLAKRLMRQVHWLARGYGWREADILGMSAWRRRYYQELLGI